MIVRYGGGNDGIAEYLENGRKAEREYTRDELDHRLILDGDLETTNKIIQGIENKGQERYRHITLSFQENDITVEMLKAITQEYKSILMNAYHEDEYCFYAEAHLPKLKHIIDNRTGELVERKPHIHIVIPETNLVTGKHLLPTGKVTITEQYLDAIQEHINNKYNLVSPKDAVRVSDQNHARVLSRVKGDLFREKKSELKKEIFSRLDTDKISSIADFNRLLSTYGDVKIRNEGKPNQYFSVKLPGDSKFTNLKNPVFSRSYIENRELKLEKPTPTQIKHRLESWEDKISHEIKHIYPKSASLRETYKNLDADGKKQFLKERIQHYDQEYKFSGSSRREGSHQRGVKQSSKKSISRRANRLSYMPQRSLVYGIRGSTTKRELTEPVSREVSQRLLPTDERRDLGEPGTKSLHGDKTMRWDDARERSTFTRGLKSVFESTVMHEQYYQFLNNKAHDNEIETLREIRSNLDSQRFLSAASTKFNIKISDYKIVLSKDGTPRFKVANRNMNVSDFLTKHLNLSWPVAKDFLIKTYAEQLADISFTNPIRGSLSNDEAKNRLISFKESQKELKLEIKIQRRLLYTEIKEMRSQLHKIKGNDRQIAQGLIVYHKLTGLESISELDINGREFINDYHNIWNEDKNPMKALQKLRELININNDENSIEAETATLSFTDRVESQKKVQEFQRTRLKDLVMQKNKDQLVFINPDNNNPVFSDKGMRLVASKEPSNEEIALMLEYAKEKFGGVLKLNGDENFKAKCALVAAEKGMSIIIKPDQYNDMMREHKADLVANQIQQDTQEQEEPSVEAGIDTNQKVEEVNAELNEREVVRTVKADIIENKTSLTPDPETHVTDLANNQTDELKQTVYIVKNDFTDESDEGALYLNFSDAEKTYNNSASFTRQAAEASNQIIPDNVIMYKTDMEKSYLQSIDLGRLQKIDPSKYEIVMQTDDWYAIEQQGVEKDKIQYLINEKATRAAEEGLDFFKKDIETELLSKDVSVSEANEYLNNEIELMRKIKSESQQDNEFSQE